MQGASFFLCGRQGAWRASAIRSAVAAGWWLGGESPYGTLTVGSASRTPRVSRATRPQAKPRPDEQKSHTRQTYPGEKSFIFKAL